MNNYDKDFSQDLIDSVEQSFKFVLSGKNKNRSANKVDIIHGIIANHLQTFLGEDYIVKTKFTTGKEEIIIGRYNDKRVDILVERKADNKQIAGLGLKFILSSFQKNSNNYFENMLGETANIRSNNIPYFQVIILLENIPNFSGDGTISSFTKLNNDLMKKYYVLSSDNTTSFYHSPLKTLVLILKDDIESKYIKNKTKEEYFNSFSEDFKFSLSNSVNIKFDSGVILNQYVTFLQKATFLIKGFD
jgi:hypothetical protein